MNDQDQNSEEKVTAAEPAPTSVEAVSLQPSTDIPIVEPASASAQTAPQPVPQHQGHREPKDLFGIQAFFTVVIFSIFVITFIVQAFQIPSGSMENTLLVGDFLLVDKLHYAGLPGSA